MSDQVSAISAALVKELREKTGVGMAKCKEALEQTKGDMNAAIDLLRKQGVASAVKKEGRDTKEGVIVFFDGARNVALCEINSETDFVAKNDKFLDFAKNLAKDIADTAPASLEAFVRQTYSKDPSLTIDQYRALMVQTIGENIQIRRLHLLKKDPAVSIGMYSHMNGKILSAVILSGPGMEAVAKDVAMHVAAASPEYLNPSAIPQEIVEKEKEIARDQVKGKPAYIMDKIIDGKINAYYDQSCLTRQKFVKNDSVSIEELVRQEGQQRGLQGVTVVGFVRWAVGQ